MQAKKTARQTAHHQTPVLAAQYREVGCKAITAALLFTRRLKPAPASAK
jgi:hypothetical protein